jgi:Aromatic acid exporter family member 1
MTLRMLLHALSPRRIGTAARAVAPVAESVASLRRRAKPPALMIARLTATAVFAYLLAMLVPAGTSRPVLAPLTALLVAQATMYQTVRSALQRVASVVVGVLIAVSSAAVFGFSWWSLGIAIGIALVIGHVMRLGDHFLEVPISAMLILATDTRIAATGRVIDTLVGAVAGLAAGLVLAPVRVRPAEQDIDDLGGRMSALLGEMAAGLADGSATERAAGWLTRARELGGAVRKVDGALNEAEDSVRLNPRGLHLTHAGVALRTGLETLEHVAVDIRALARCIADGATLAGPAGPVNDDEAREGLAAVLRELSASVRTFGRLVPADVASRHEPVESELEQHLSAAGERQDALADRLRSGAAAGEDGWPLHGEVLMHLDRLRAELQVERRARERERWPRRRSGAAWYSLENRRRLGIQVRPLRGPSRARPLRGPGRTRPLRRPARTRRVRRR